MEIGAYNLLVSARRLSECHRNTCI